MQIIAPRQSFVDGGVPVTYQGTPNVCTYWEVVGVDGESIVSPSGSVSREVVITDTDGFAVNQYVGSGDDADAGKIDRIRVYEAEHA